MSKYSKFMKERLQKKRVVNVSTIEVFYHCNVVMASIVATKKEDPGAFIILCTFRVHKFNESLCDLGASINLILLIL